MLVIGSGPAGRRAAVQSAKLGKSVLVVDRGRRLGGVSVHTGTIPSKTLRETVLNLSGWRERGFYGQGYRVKQDISAIDLMQRLHKTLDHEVEILQHQFMRNMVRSAFASARFVNANEVELTTDSGEVSHIGFDKALIAVGTQPFRPDHIPFDKTRVFDSDEILEIERLPRTLTVIGGGVIGLELGAVWGRLGADVTVIEYMDKILPTMDGELSKEMLKILTKQGMTFKLSTKVASAVADKKGVTLEVEPAAGGAKETLKADIVLVAVGRKAYTDGLGLDEVGVERDERGRVKTDAHFQSNVAGIYAIGDVIAGPMLAHKAEDEGVVLAEILAGQTGHIDYNLIPGVVYTWPEVASVGQTEEQLKGAGVDYKIGKFPFMANGRARAMNCTDGFVKILACAKTDRVLGCHIIGPEAGTLIAEVTAVMEFGGSSEDIARTCHAHPTLEEVVKEAALAVLGRPLHI